MKDTIFCPECDKSFRYEHNDYWEYEEGDEMEEIECEHCKTKLSMSWYSTHYFQCNKKE